MLNLSNSMEKEKKITNSRILAIDFVRGLAIILMALDHASAFWNVGKRGGSGLVYFWNEEVGAFTDFHRPIFPDLINFLVRFVTHWCAPTFIFLAGTSIVLFEAKRLEKGVSQSEISKHLIIRGLILLLIEWTIIAWAFHAEPFYFGVLALLGVGFIIFAFFRRVDPKVVLIFSLVLFLGPLIDYFLLGLPGRYFSFFNPGFIISQFPASLQNYFFTVTYIPQYPPLIGLYPLDPWLGVMGMGFVFGHWLQKQNIPEDNQFIAKRLAMAGGVSIFAFFVLRLTQGWPFNHLSILDAKGDPFSIETFFLLAKYPPSLGFLLWTLGGMCLALSVAFYFQNHEWFQKWTSPIVLFGATPLFFYSTHLLLYGAVPIFMSILSGEPTHNTFIITLFGDALFLSLLVTLVVWILGLLILYPACVQFRHMKKMYPDPVFKYI
ncbi:MAG: DUF1624 domain-containing protein [Candidatus Heimdallarchaeota archaeon]|nr:MAG: DUF1624 domain-containing protein [Candidatus Heimdallarchaeota archaeon]